MSRTHFLDELDSRLAQALQHASGAPVALVLAEADTFEMLCGWYGYRETSQQLQLAELRVDARLQNLGASLGSPCVFARVGDAAFAVALFDALARDAAGVAQLLRDDLRGPWRLGGEARDISFSLGVSATDSVVDADSLYALAHHALARALRQRNVVEAAGNDELQRQERSRVIGTSLRRGLDRGELRLEYQPIVDLDTLSVRGLEALVRWDHPTLGLVMPAEFVEIAARAGCLGDLGDWVLHHACQDFARLRRTRALDQLQFLSVNVSRQNLADPGLPDKVIRSLRAAGMAPRQLLLEITESELLTDPVRTSRTLRLMRSLGMRIAIDDFGVGHSSLASLHELPVDVLKLDRSFVGSGSFRRNRRDLAAITHAIVNMARSVDLEVVLEGVETAEQLQMVRSLQCSLAQGFWLCRPVPADALEEGCASLAAIRGKRPRLTVVPGDIS